MNEHDYLLSPIFIIGVPRSGTTLLRVILDSHAEVSAPPETPWILGSYTGSTSVRSLIEEFQDSPYSPTKTLNGVTDKTVLESARLMLNHFFKKHLEFQQKKVIVLKTPDDAFYLEWLVKLFPKSKYIHIIRDGRDVACSTVGKRDQFFGKTFHKGYGDVTYYNSIRRWTEWESKIRSIFEQEEVNFIRIRYEELVSTPIEIMNVVFEFLDIPYDENVLNYNKTNHIYPSYEAGSFDVKNKDRIDTSSVNRWKREIPKKELIKIAMDFDKYFIEWGYGKCEISYNQNFFRKYFG